MLKGFEFSRSKMVTALALMAAGAVALFSLTRVVRAPGSDLASLGLVLGGLVLYIGILVIVGMFRNETYLSMALLLPSILAVAIFVYGFIGWSIRSSPFLSWRPSCRAPSAI